MIVHNVRSTHNVGSLLRTCDGLGVEKVYMTGYTPYPGIKKDTRLPHLVKSLSQRIHKTALGAETSVAFKYRSDIKGLLTELRQSGFKIVGLEQTVKSSNITKFKTKDPIALIVGEEVAGLSLDIVALTDWQLEIPMLGQKESFNVAVAAAMALYHLRFLS